MTIAKKKKEKKTKSKKKTSKAELVQPKLQHQENSDVTVKKKKKKAKQERANTADTENRKSELAKEKASDVTPSTASSKPGDNLENISDKPSKRRKKSKKRKAAAEEEKVEVDSESDEPISKKEKGDSSALTDDRAAQEPGAGRKEKKKRKRLRKKEKSTETADSDSEGKAKKSKKKDKEKVEEEVKETPAPAPTVDSPADCPSSKSLILPQKGQWATAELGNSDRQKKFMKLLGGNKSSNQTTNEAVADKEKKPFLAKFNAALNKKQETELNSKLERQFEQARNAKLGAKGQGLGFGSRNAMDTSSRSKKFDD